MMPDLGKYTATVLGAYGVAIALLLVLTVWSLLRARRVRRQLAKMERKGRRNG